MEIRGENEEYHEANKGYTPESVADIPVLLLGVAEGGVVYPQSSWSNAGGWHCGCSALMGPSCCSDHQNYPLLVLLPADNHTFEA